MQNDIFTNEFIEKITPMYDDINAAKDRYLTAINTFKKLYNKDKFHIFSAPGRTEIIGNHTDHQRGMTMAGSVNLDVIGIAAKNGTDLIRVISYGYSKEDIVDINNLKIVDRERGRSVSLVRGIANKFVELGYKLEGIDIYVSSNVLKGSGLSSSAAFEVLIATVINHICCDGKEDAISIAKIGQYAENVYFGKPCGLLDQMASSVGGFVYMDFCDSNSPKVEKIELDYKKEGYTLCIVDTGGSHADLTNDYADVSIELKKICKYFNKEVLREVPEEEFVKNIVNLRHKAGDRAVLRAYHVYNENKRVLKAKDMLQKGDFESFLNVLKESGNSSFKFLQNVYSTSNTSEQGLVLALLMSEKILENRGSYRVHGGGFAGTIQAFVPNDLVEEYVKEMENVFGEGKCHKLFVRPYGAIKLL